MYNDEYDYLDKYVAYDYEAKSFGFIDKTIARSELSEKEYNLIEQHLKYVNESCSEDLAGATAGILAAIPACQQAATIAGVIAGVLYFGGKAIELLNKLGGNKGLVVRFYRNGTFTCTPF